MAKYKFEQFNLEIVDPIIIMTAVYDNVLNRTCKVDLELTADGAKFGVTLQGYTYTSDWSDDEVRIWAFTELEKYEV
jgi:hypothetical protein